MKSLSELSCFKLFIVYYIFYNMSNFIQIFHIKINAIINFMSKDLIAEH